MSQILRNVVSNALKFTERGEVRVAARAGDRAARRRLHLPRDGPGALLGARLRTAG